MTHSSLTVLESEHAVIGAAMNEPAACAAAFDRLTPDHFHEPYHGRIWKKLRQGGPVDPTALAQAFANDPAFADMGGARYFFDLWDKAYIPTVDVHASAILDAAMRRQIHAVATSAAARAATTPGEAGRIIADLERAAADIARERASSAVPLGLDALENLEAAWRGDFRGEPVGLDCIDKVTGGIRPTDVWFVGGRTSMGKSVMGLEIAHGIAAQGRGVLIFSLEMPKVECQMRMIASAALARQEIEQVRYGDLLKGKSIPPALKDRAKHAARYLAGLPILVDDAGGLTIDEIRSRALRQVRTWEKAGIQPGAIIIDHIGLVAPVRKTENKAADTSDTVNELKPLAKALRCGVVALVQINRGTEGRNDKRPTVADLNWSGAIEQIADFVGLLYRESYYLARSSSREDQNRADLLEHELEIIIAKNRSGPICHVKAWVDVASNAVRDAA